ncbi:acyltransferase family protein [Sphingobacterium rhinopitheci]|uniref:acyltransferase family protein n=1 Tax=Sphingobacterium rhinopitheci TaxID=2781960 RepID=UPI0021D45B7D|nr:acyltransferase [Sphingobacterium rhinopitheci]MCI0920474.1 acyltransferase [Sphingobacterium rhinopitheci]
MRFPLAFLVVIAHMLPFTNVQIEPNLSIENIYIFISEMISHNFAKIPVRLFFIISGFFFFLNLDKLSPSSYKEKLSKKLRYLVVPYISWNAIMIAAICIVNYIGALLFARPQNELPTLYDSFWGGPINFPLWYIRNLIVIIILSPVIYYFIKYTKIYGLIALYIFYVLFHNNYSNVIEITTVLFFSIGAYIGLNNIDIIAIADKHKKVMAIVSVILLLTATLNSGKPTHEYIFRLFIIPGIITLFNLFNYLFKNQKIRGFLFKFAPTSFFIYVAHEIFIINWIKGAIHRYSILSTGIGKIISYFVGPIICVIICVILFNILNRIMPKTLDFITGKRARSPKQTASISAIISENDEGITISKNTNV